MSVVRITTILILFFGVIGFTGLPDVMAQDMSKILDTSATGSVQAPAVTDAEPPPPQKSYLKYMAESLGWIFGPAFLVLSVAAVAYVLMNGLALRQETVMPAPLIEQFDKLVKEKDYQGAYESARESESFLGKVLAAGISKMNLGKEHAVQEMQVVAERETMRLEHRLGVLALIGSISPMVGLLGTVVGMIQSFQSLAISAKGQMLAGGIATALVTTEVGLFIAIPVIVIYDFYRNRMSALLLDSSIVTDQLMTGVPGFEKK